MKTKLSWNIVRRVVPLRYCIHEHISREHLGPCNCGELFNSEPRIDWAKLSRDVTRFVLRWWVLPTIKKIIRPRRTKK